VPIKGLDWEIDKVISNNMLMRLDMKEMIRKALELNPEIDEGFKQICRHDISQVLLGNEPISWLADLYDDKVTSSILIFAMQMPISDPADLKVMQEIIRNLSARGIGMDFKDQEGNFIEQYAIKYWDQYGELLMEECLNRNHYDKFAENNHGANVVHTAVYYGRVAELHNKLTTDNLDFTKKMKKLGDCELTPFDIAVAMESTESIEQITNILGIVPKSDLFARSILSFAQPRKEMQHSSTAIGDIVTSPTGVLIIAGVAFVVGGAVELARRSGGECTIS
jgi:hypothetical protein